MPHPTPASRHDGWTAAAQTGFIEALAHTGSVTHAAAAVGRSASTAYRLRARPEGKAFRAAWEAATAHAYERVREIALDRLLHGVEAPVVYRGEIVDHKRVFSDRLLMFMLDHLKPDNVNKRGDYREADNVRSYAQALSALADAPSVTDAAEPPATDAAEPPASIADAVADQRDDGAAPAPCPVEPAPCHAEPAPSPAAPVPSPSLPSAAAHEWADLEPHLARRADPDNPYALDYIELLEPEDREKLQRLGVTLV